MRRHLILATALVPAASCAEPRAEALTESVIALELVARFDTDASPERPPFGSVIDIELDSMGSVFVLDGLSRTVSVFDSEGTPLRSFGGRGQGPGELERPAGLTWGPAGKLWILDVGTGRFSVFEPGGDLIATYRVSGPRPWSPLVMRFSHDGVLRTVGLDLQGGSLEQPDVVLVEYGVNESIVEPARQIDLPFVKWPDVFDYRGDEVTLLMLVPFSPEPMFGIDPEGRLWYGEADPGRVHRWLAADSFDLTVGRDLVPIPVTSADVERALEDNPDVQELEAVGGASAYADFLERIPDHQPHLQGFFLGDDESVWVMRTPVAVDDDGTRPTDVYDVEGELLGSLEIAVAANPRPRVRAGWLAGVVRDELGVESVALYQIIR